MLEGPKVHVCFLPPCSSSLMQPLDITVFKHIKEEYRNLVENYLHNDDIGTSIVPDDKFVEFWNVARDKLMSKEHIQTVFVGAGLCPMYKMKVLGNIKLETKGEKRESKLVGRRIIGGRKRFVYV